MGEFDRCDRIGDQEAVGEKPAASPVGPAHAMLEQALQTYLEYTRGMIQPKVCMMSPECYRIFEAECLRSDPVLACGVRIQINDALGGRRFFFA